MIIFGTQMFLLVALHVPRNAASLDKLIKIDRQRPRSLALLVPHVKPEKKLFLKRHIFLATNLLFT